MAENEYIKKIYESGLDVGQINQLLKIYEYTKDLKIDLSEIEYLNDINVLRSLANKFKTPTDYTIKYINSINEALKDGIYINDLISDKYSEYHTLKMIDLRRDDIDTNIIEIPELTNKQLDELLEIIALATEKDIPIKEIEGIFDNKNDFGAMNILFRYYISDNCDKHFFNELLEIHNFDKINELIIAKETLSKDEFDIVKNIKDTKYMHVISSLFRNENEKSNINEYLKCKTVKELLKMFIDRNKESDIETEEAEEKPRDIKHHISSIYDKDQFFKLNNGDILKVYYEDEIDWNWLQEGMFGEVYEGDEIPQDCLETFFSDKTDKIKKIIDTFLYIGYTKDGGREAIDAFDLLTNKEIEYDMQEYSSIFETIALEHDSFLDDYTDNTIEYMSSGYSDGFISFFENASDLKKYGGPNVDNEILFGVIRDMSSSWALVATKEDIEKEYDKFDKESIASAKRLFKAQMEEQEEVLDGYVYGYTLYNSNGEEIDDCTMFIGEHAIDDIIGCIGNEILYEIGNFNDIEDCLEYIEEREEEER